MLVVEGDSRSSESNCLVDYSGQNTTSFRIWSNEKPLTNSKSFCKYFHDSGIYLPKHSSLLSYLPQEISLNIDMNRILPVKISGVCHIELRRLMILSQSCNDVNPGKIFHSNSVDSPLTSSKSL